MARKKAKQKEAEERGLTKMLATTVMLGIVFAAGLITGQRLLRAEARGPMVSLSTTRQAPTAAADEPAPSLRTTFSFYEHLSADAVAAAPPAEAKAAETATPPPPAAPKVAEVVVQKEVATVATPAAVPAVAVPPASPTIVAAAPAVAPPKPSEPAASAPTRTLLDEVVNSIAPADAKANQGAALPARYTLQVSSHPDRESAEREVSRLSAMGVEPHVVAVDVPGKGQLFRVRVGKFHDMDEARNFQGSMKDRRGVAGFVTPL